MKSAEERSHSDKGQKEPMFSSQGSWWFFLGEGETFYQTMNCCTLNSDHLLNGIMMLKSGRKK